MSCGISEAPAGAHLRQRAGRRRGILVSLCLSLLLLVGGVAAWAGPGGGSGGSSQPVAFSGQATVVRANVLGVPIVLADTGPLPAAGGAQNASLLEADELGLLSAKVLHAATIGQGDRSRSEASVADLNLVVGGHTIAAEFLMARAMAVCGPRGPVTSGSSDIALLTIDGQPIAVTGAPNQRIALPVGEVIINEQTTQSSKHYGSITVNALHVVIPGVADVVIASAHADITCSGKPVCRGGDFVTGGGWIVTDSGSRANFAVAGGIRNGSFWGHLNYIDHGTSLKVKGTGVTAYVVTGPTSRHIEGTCEINGVPGTYMVDVADEGEPGRGRDGFRITLSMGYTAGNTLAGGNVQLHRPCK